jgi:hypothetical protein
MSFIRDLLCNAIEQLGSANIFSVVMDGTWKLVEKLVHSHTNLVLRESLDDSLHHLVPWDIELIIDDPVDEFEEEPESQRTCIKHFFLVLLTSLLH